MNETKKKVELKLKWKIFCIITKEVLLKKKFITNVFIFIKNLHCV